jgi:hypothetical protein
VINKYITKYNKINLFYYMEGNKEDNKIEKNEQKQKKEKKEKKDGKEEKGGFSKSYEAKSSKGCERFLAISNVHLKQSFWNYHQCF